MIQFGLSSFQIEWPAVVEITMEHSNLQNIFKA